ncbi:helix-turn-helix domain-containing protein [Niabella drilacis]|uniref:DNA-binding transcriptional regulator, XRE-family HTH domain n=1 Tax=Niabella drilacis (strain DSM 25811 / CCM 8410 / CCUG 62505 / LMG 26954 / E90) TaxID=1285928 RepID=A0A1G6UJS3_NIADE|nr:helix-turn-helix transcriptional regulator [Niabella drilacis]SDD41519.1 DNA-binding transcriptional regulator, XRE-family HTH domain [Niabella drilacis]
MTEQQLLKKLGLKIKQLRTEKGLSQNAFGLEVNLEKSNVSRLEAGNVNPKFITLVKVAKALNLPVSELVKLD